MEVNTCIVLSIEWPVSAFNLMPNAPMKRARSLNEYHTFYPLYQTRSLVKPVFMILMEVRRCCGGVRMNTQISQEWDANVYAALEVDIDEIIRSVEIQNDRMEKKWRECP